MTDRRPRARIDDMRLAQPIVQGEAPVVAGRRDGAVAQFDHCRRPRAGRVGRLDGNAPGAPRRGVATRPHFSADLHHVVATARHFQPVGQRIDGMALRDGGEIDAHRTGPAQPPAVHLQEAVADTLACRFDRGSVRRVSTNVTGGSRSLLRGPRSETPRVHKGADGHIECAAGGGRDFERRTYHRGQRRREFHPGSGRDAVEPGDLRIVVPVRENSVEVCERRRDGLLLESRLAPRDDPVGSTHRRAGEAPVLVSATSRE